MMVLGRLWVLLAIATTASADPLPERATAGVGLSAGVVPDWFYGAVSLQAGVRIPEMPFRVRAFAAVGKAKSTDSDGDLYEVSAGLEWIFACGGRVCGIAAVDAGYLKSDRVSRSEGYRIIKAGPILGPRIGADIRVSRLRIRTALELYGFRATETGSFSYVSWDKALGLSAAVVVAF